MKQCPECGYVDSDIWRVSKWNRSVDFARYEDFLDEFHVELEKKKPVQIGSNAYLLTGTGIYVERQSLINNPMALTQWKLDYERNTKSKR